MTIEVGWYDSKEDILHYKFGEIWGWHEYEPIIRQGRALMQTKPHYVGVINDLRAMRVNPSMLISKAHHYIDSRPENTGIAIFVSSSMFFNKIYDMLIQIYPAYVAQYQLETDFDHALNRVRNWLDEHKDTHFEVE